MKKQSIFQVTFLLALSCITFFQCRKENDTLFKDRLVVESIAPMRGKPSTHVIIKGTGFSLVLNEDTVKFNGKTAHIIKTTDSTIEVTAPQGGSTGKVMVTVRDKSVEGPVFTYQKTDQPQITSISPKVGWDYTKNAVTITGKNFGKERNKVTVTFDGKAASLQSFSSTKLIVSPPKHDAGKVKVKVIVTKKSSNEAEYIYQLAPYIWGGGYDYFYEGMIVLGVVNLSSPDSSVHLFVNGKEITKIIVKKSGEPLYGGRDTLNIVVVDDEQSLEFIQSMAKNAFVEAQVSCYGLISRVYDMQYKPRISKLYSKTGNNKFSTGDTLYIKGKFFGDRSKVNSYVEVTHIYPLTRPTILTWTDTLISLKMPKYDVPKAGNGLRLVTIIVRAGELHSAGIQIEYVVNCPQLNEIYTGEYQYPNSIAQPYAFKFFGKDSMYFTSSADRYPGTYTYDCTTKEIKMDFAGHGVIVKATRESNALTHFQFIKSSGFTFLSANLNTTWSQNLDGTKWYYSGEPNTLHLVFASGNKVKLFDHDSWSNYKRENGIIDFTVNGDRYFGFIENKIMELSRNGVIYKPMKE